MGGLALLPWEKWAARLLHWMAVAIVRQASRLRRRWSLSHSAAWPEVEGTVEQVIWEIAYSYYIEGTSYSGYHYAWFNPSNRSQVREGDKALLRHKPGNPGESVFVRLASESREGPLIGTENR